MALSVTSGSQAVKKAKTWIGTPYCWGGGHGVAIAPGKSSCVDCSGLVNQVYGTTGNTGTQVMLGAPITSIQQALPGDLVFFGAQVPQEPHHVGIYVGNNQMIDAPHSGTVVRQESIQGFGPIDGIRRLVPPDGASNGATPDASGPIFTYAQLEGIWILAGGNAQTASMAAAIAMAESGGNANASNSNSNGSVDRGLWQINDSNGSASSFDVMTNARGAVAISNGGTNWRPWCTAYSDGSCGKQGGVYQGPGSPYLRFLNTNIPPDTSVNINATNAAANLASSSTEATLDSSLFGTDGPILCILKGPENCFNAGGSAADNLAANTIKGIMHAVLNPIIQPIAGVMGVTAGAVLMIGGVYVLVSGTRAGRGVSNLTRQGIIAANPELGAFFARTGGERSAYISARSARVREQAREGQSRQEYSQRRAGAAERHAQRMEAMSTQDQLRRESMAYQEYLRRSRSGPGPRRPGAPRGTSTGQRQPPQRAITTGSRRSQ